MVAAVAVAIAAVSIHALRGEGDFLRHRDGRMRVISIHALRGEGDIYDAAEYNDPDGFQSTPSVGRATVLRGHCQR